MSVAARIAAALLSMVLLIALSTGWLAQVAQDLAEENRELARVDVEALALGLNAWSRLGELDELVAKYELLDDPRYRDEALRLIETIDVDFSALEEMQLSPDLQAAADELLDDWRRQRLDVAGEGLSVMSPEALRDRLRSVLATARAEMARIAEESTREAERAVGVAWTVAGVALVLAMLLGAVLTRSVVAPLRRLGRGTGRVASGDFSTRVPEQGPREVADLAEDFNAMAVELGRLDELKRDLVSNVSHDLKAPLASMLETTSLLLDEVPGRLEPQQEKLLRLNLESGERLSNMIVNVLDLSRLDAGAAVVRVGPCSVEDLFGAAEAELTAFAEARGVSLELSEPGLELSVAADRELLLRALVNVTQNALKFSPPGEEVLLSATELNDGRVRLEVIDRGPGIPDDEKARVFERFHRADASHRGEQGTGLGLAIARAVVGVHGGSIRVVDTEGGGSRFQLDLPAAEPDSANRERDSAPVEDLDEPLGVAHG